MTDSHSLAHVRALAFDVFGTTVDWRGSIQREAESLAAKHGLTGDCGRFADAWRAGYKPAMNEVREGRLPWMNLDALNRKILDSLLDEFSLSGIDDSAIAHLNCAWHQLSPWPDAVAGLNRLKQRFIVTTLSNGNMALLTNMAKHTGLPWDCIISAELFGHYKPDPETYLGAARLLDIAANELMMVAAHPEDLRAAKALGCRTAYVKRPNEFGGKCEMPAVAKGEFDLVAEDFIDLAQQLHT